MAQKLLDWANQGPSNDYTLVGQDPVRTEREKSEGVDYDGYMLGRRSLWMWEWYGKWRPLVSENAASAAEDDLKQREVFEADWVVKFIPGLREIVGVQDLLQLYPKMRKRRPFVESTLIKDGTYRPKGFGALLEDIEDDLTQNSQLFQAAGELSVWPIVFFKPGAVTKPGAFRMQPGMAIPAEDPSSVNVVKLLPNLAVTIQPYGLSFLVSRELLENAAVVSQPGVSRLAVILLEKLLQHVRPPLAMLRQVRLFALAFLPVRHGQH